MVYSLIRLWSILYPLHEDGKSPVKSPANFQVFREDDPPSEGVKKAVARAYVEAFSGPPWFERWDEQEVLAKMEVDLKPPFRLVVMEGNEEYPVGGFCWGAVIDKEEVVRRIVLSAGLKGTEEEELERVLERRIEGKEVFFLDEIAILPPFRGGITPIQFLIRPLLEACVSRGHKEGVSWTHRSSTIAYISRYAGFRPLEPTFDDKLVIYCGDCRPILRLLQNVDGERIAALIKGVSKALGVKRR